MPVEVKPVCQSWYEEIDRGDYYFFKAWMTFIFIYAVSFSLRYAHKLKRKNGELRFDIPTLVNFQKLAVLLMMQVLMMQARMMQALMIILPLSFDPERISANLEVDWGVGIGDAEQAATFTQALLPSVLSFFVLVLISFLTIRFSSQSFKNTREKLLVADTIDPEETIHDLEAHAPYSGAFCLQYVPRGKLSYNL